MRQWIRLVFGLQSSKKCCFGGDVGGGSGDGGVGCVTFGFLVLFSGQLPQKAKKNMLKQASTLAFNCAQESGITIIILQHPSTAGCRKTFTQEERAFVWDNF